MTDLQDQFEVRARQAAEERRRTDFNDLQNERAGLETGRIARFLDADTREARAGRGKGSDKTGAHLSRLQQLLAANPAYAALYHETFDKLRAAEAAAERALSLAIEARAKARQALDDTLERAATLPDGTRVFRDDNGDVRTEHGDKIAPEIAAGIQWRRDEPGYETLTSQRKAFETFDNTVAEIRGVQVDKLGRFRNELEDKANPLGERRLKEVGEESARLKADIDTHLSSMAELEAPALSPAPDATTAITPRNL